MANATIVVIVVVMMALVVARLHFSLELFLCFTASDTIFNTT